jgi:phosphoglycerol transferase MdoB-like AlkP superfamily enzyme
LTCLSLIFVGSPVAALLRALAVEQAEAANLGRPADSVLSVLIADAPLVGTILCLGVAGFFLPVARRRWRWLAMGPRVASLTLFLVQALDLALVWFLSMRLEFADVARFWSEGRAGLTLAVGLQPWLGRRIPPVLLGVGLAVACLAFLAAVLTLPFARTAPRALVRAAAAVGLLSVATVVVPADQTRFHGWAYPNVIVANLPRSTAVPYSKKYFGEAERLRGIASTRPGLNSRANVIIYVIESLSSCQSARFGGTRDFTPALDRLAGRGLSAREFVANGFTTNLGLVALLTGRIPLPSVGDGSGDSFAGFLEGPSLPKALASRGYFTEFLTTSDLGFTRKGEWLARIGFESLRGSRDAAFDGWPRFAFDAAPDEALVTAAAHREKALRSDPGSRPFLLVVESATSHMPFVHPNGTDHTEEAVFRYVDSQVGRLARLLEESGFLENGILVVTSDHRKMAPLDAEEHRRWGLSAFSRIPFVVLGGGVSARELEQPFQQADLPGSLLCLLTTDCPADPFRGSLFTDPPRPPSCVLSPMGNDRGLAYVRCGTAEALVRLDGDATRVVRGRLAPSVEAGVFREIALVRRENEPLPWPRGR